MNSEAYVPVLLSLMKLYARSLWYTLQGGKDGLNLWTYDEDKRVAYPLMIYKFG